MQDRRDERAYQRAVNMLDLREGIEASLTEAASNDELKDYAFGLGKISSRIRAVKDDPKGVHFGTIVGERIHLIEGGERIMTPPRETFIVQVATFLRSPDGKADTLLTHVMQVASNALDVPYEDRQLLVQTAKQALRQSVRGTASEVPITDDWRIRVQFHGDRAFASIYLEPIEKLEYADHWRAMHQETLRGAIDLEKVREIMNTRSAREYCADNQPIGDWELFNIGTMDDVRRLFASAGWERTTDDQVLQFLQEVSSNNYEEIYRHKDASSKDPFLGITQWSRRETLRGEDEVSISTIASPGYTEAVKRAFYEKFTHYASQTLHDTIAKIVRRGGQTRQIDIEEIINTTLEALGQEVDPYDEPEEFPILGRFVVAALAEKLNGYPKLAHIVRKMKDYLQTEQPSAEHIIYSSGWHPEEMEILLSPEDFSS